MKNNLTTEAGQTEQAQTRDQRVDAINQVFALFKLNYHNQFFKAYRNEADLTSTKRLWFESLAPFTADTVLRAAKAVIESSEFLPTLRTMIKHCEALNQLGLPDAHAAYIEACRAPSPKADFSWSHPAVYHAGKASDWYFLQNNTENVAYPIFKQEYENIAQRIRLGEEFRLPASQRLEDKPAAPLSGDENRKRMASLRDALDL